MNKKKEMETQEKLIKIKERKLDKERNIKK